MARRENFKKIDTGGGGDGGLQNPFAALSSDGLPAGECIAPPLVEPKDAKPARRGRVVLRRETAHRGGKAVVVAGDFAPEVTVGEIEELARHLRKSCGCGGTVRGREIEIQGDQPAKVCALLEELGFRVAGVRR
jgi:translation initiation factor 1